MSDTTPIILVPGLASSSRIWLPVIPVLWTFGPVTVVNHSRDDQMGAIAKRILKDAPSRFALAGHSMGGAIALEMFRLAPERITRLALLNSYARPSTPEFNQFVRGWIAEVSQGRYQTVMSGMFASAVHPSRQNDTTMIKTVLDMADEVGPDAFVRQLEAIMTRADSRPMLATIKCPTLVLTSDSDNSVPNHLSAEIAGGIRGAKLVTLTKCGHLSPLEKPQAVSEAFVDWLAM